MAPTKRAMSAKGYPVRRRNDDVVSFVDDCPKTLKIACLPPMFTRHSEVVFGAEIARMLLDDRFLQIADSARRRVFGEVRVDGSDAGLPDIFRGRKVRLAGTEVDDVHTLSRNLPAASPTAIV